MLQSLQQSLDAEARVWVLSINADKFLGVELPPFSHFDKKVVQAIEEFRQHPQGFDVKESEVRTVLATPGKVG